MRTYSKNTGRQTPGAPSWTAILTQAANTPGMMLEAYSAFHDYSVGNQLLALAQCQLRGITPGPIKTFPGWQALGRNVKRGERALVLCMPITRKRRNAEAGARDEDDDSYTMFVYRPRWFVLAQTEGEEMPPLSVPGYDPQRTLAELGVESVEFDLTDGNCQGFARGRQIAINPVAQLTHKTFFHETAHVVLGHTAEGDFTDTETTPRNLREVEAEAVALLCCESLGLEGAEYCRGYIQHWLRGEVIPEQSAQTVLRAADRILRAGRERTGDID
jgi:antirestriction protein ArdC